MAEMTALRRLQRQRNNMRVVFMGDPNAMMAYFYLNFTEEEAADCPSVCGSLACAVLVAFLDDHHSSWAGSGDFALNSAKTSGTIGESTYRASVLYEVSGSGGTTDVVPYEVEKVY